jgi:hypothetical protein
MKFLKIFEDFSDLDKNDIEDYLYDLTDFYENEIVDTDSQSISWQFKFKFSMLEDFLSKLIEIEKILMDAENLHTNIIKIYCSESEYDSETKPGINADIDYLVKINNLLHWKDEFNLSNVMSNFKVINKDLVGDYNNDSNLYVTVLISRYKHEITTNEI